MASSDNKIEIKLITDYREYLLSKIESLKVSLDHIASSFGNEVSSSIDEFSRRINVKLKNIDERFTKNTEELEAVRAELLSKKFDESNFNNVSQVRRLDKIVNERDLKIKELESRIRYLECNSASTNATATATANSATANSTKVKKEPEAVIKQKPETIITKEIEKKKEQKEQKELVEVPAEIPTVAPETNDTFKDAPRVQDADGDIIIAVSAKKSRSKTDKKKAPSAGGIVLEASSAIDESAIIEEKPKKPIRKIKKASKVEKEEEDSIAVPVIPIPVQKQETDPSRDIDENNDATEAQLQADEEALRLAQEEAAEAERLEEEQRLEAEAERLEEERVAKAAAELEKKKKTEVAKKQVISKKDNNEAKQPIPPKKIISKTTAIPIPDKLVEAIPALPSSKTKETSKPKPDYPDKLPEVEDLDVITVDGNDYYCDKNNQGVYQMINGDDIGAFLGYYDLHSETIKPVEVEP